MPKKRIIFNGSYFSKKPNGISLVSRELAKSINPNLMTLLAPFSDNQTNFQKIPDNLSPDFGLYSHARRLFWNQFHLGNYLKKERDSILLSPLPEAPIFRGIQSIVLVHDLLPLRIPYLTPLLPYHLCYVPIVLKNATKVLCNSLATATEVHEKLNISHKKIEIVKLGFNRNTLKPLKRVKENFFLIIARHTPHKNIPRILKAFCNLKKFNKSTKHLRLKIVGQYNKKFTPSYIKLSSKLGIQESCDWIYLISENEKLELLNRCQALIIASLWEGFGLPALEAMACGTLVIASNKGALPEILNDNGILIDPNNLSSIEAGMKRALNDELLRDEFRATGPLIANKYCWKNTAKQIEEIISEI